MHIPAKVDYAMRALLELAQCGHPETAEDIATAQDIPAKFLAVILNDLRRAELVKSRRGLDGGYWLARSASQITVAEVMRAIDGPLADVRGLRPEAASYEGAAQHLQDVWIAARASLRAVLEPVTLQHVIEGKLPPRVTRLVSNPDAWVARPLKPQPL